MYTQWYSYMNNLPMQSSDCMNPPNFNYKPNDYIILTIAVAVIFGIFFIGSLFCSIPAVVLSVKVSVLKRFHLVCYLLICVHAFNF